MIGAVVFLYTGFLDYNSVVSGWPLPAAAEPLSVFRSPTTFSSPCLGLLFLSRLDLGADLRTPRAAPLLRTLSL